MDPAIQGQLSQEEEAMNGVLVISHQRFFGHLELWLFPEESRSFPHLGRRSRFADLT